MNRNGEPGAPTSELMPGSDSEDARAAGSGAHSQPLRSTWLLAAAMACAAVVITAPGALRDPGALAPDVRWMVLLPLFALAEVVVIHLPTQRNAHGHTLREIPAVLGLTFLTPQQYVTAYVVERSSRSSSRHACVV